MNSIFVPGRYACHRYVKEALPGEYVAIHGGGESLFSNRYDIPTWYRDDAPSLFETNFSRHVLLISALQDWNVPVSGLCLSLHDSCRDWIHTFFEGRYSASAYRAFVYPGLFDAEAVDQEQAAEGECLALFRGRYESKAQYCITFDIAFDSILTGRQLRCPNRFSVSRGNLRGMYRSEFDVLRIWMPDVYRGLHDLNITHTACFNSRFLAVVDPSEWNVIVRDRYPCLVANPWSYRVQGKGKYDFAEAPPWTIYRFLYDAFLYFFNEYPAYRQAFVRPGWRIMAKNLETEQFVELGFIDADNPIRSLENIGLPDGDYEISVLTSSLFWKDSMDGNVRTISVRPGEEVSPLPVIHNLRSAVADGATTVYWSASKSEIDECLFGVWYSSEEPVDVNRSPDATVWYSSTMTEYQNSFAQNAPAWVAVAAMRTGEETETGKVHQLYLDWSNTLPRAPDDVVILDEPLPVFDADVLERPVEDVDLALVF